MQLFYCFSCYMWVLKQLRKIDGECVFVKKGKGEDAVDISV